MNEKIQAILLKIVLEMKKSQWAAAPDWELTLKSEGHVPLVKNVPVEGQIDNEKWTDVVQTHLELKLTSDDQITYFPEYSIYANIFIEGGADKDIAYKMDADVAFTANDLKDRPKMQSCADKINRLVENHIQSEFFQYIDRNAEEIIRYRESGDAKADQEEDL